MANNEKISPFEYHTMDICMLSFTLLTENTNMTRLQTHALLLLSCKETFWCSKRDFEAACDRSSSGKKNEVREVKIECFFPWVTVHQQATEIWLHLFLSLLVIFHLDWMNKEKSDLTSLTLWEVCFQLVSKWSFSKWIVIDRTLRANSQ